jgi:hypothetical protein
VSLDDCLLRFEWACQHLATLDVEIGPFREAYRNPPVTVELKKGGEVRDYTLGHVPEIPARLSLIVGDCLHNFRART